MNGTDGSPPKIVLYDSVCHLCDASIRFVLPRDSRARFRFASLQGEAARELMMRHGIKLPSPPESLILIEAGKPYFYSDAALRIARGLDFPWNLAAVFRIVPRPIRNFVYAWVARNRYRWFGRSEACLLPKPEWRDRFLEGPAQKPGRD